ncbi:hypothetical protein Pla52o_13940 [Novipirellula galeiformis]|uniref:Uncharacterized protein n=1 Tax=Novipirellula galeiformis TaxID=2528004 RepID=A0A5C6CPV1_9BACT|nr:hypothetical protein Pla52o_13940 [Novipirellula galeiformis]
MTFPHCFIEEASHAAVKTIRLSEVGMRNAFTRRRDQTLAGGRAQRKPPEIGRTENTAPAGARRSITPDSTTPFGVDEIRLD